MQAIMGAMRERRDDPEKLSVAGDLYRDLCLAGAQRVMQRREYLDQINVFPVPDGDTGTNLACTLRGVGEAAMLSTSSDLSVVAGEVADAALMSARGNSGAMVAQFFLGMAEGIGDRNMLPTSEWGGVAITAARMTRQAVSQPREGTILTVVDAWADGVQASADSACSFSEALGRGLEAARASLAETPEMLAVLKEADVVDAGAQGFVYWLEGVQHLLDTGEWLAVDWKREVRRPGPLATEIEAEGSERYCSECVVRGEGIDLGLVREQVASLGSSLVVAGSSRRVRIHLHTNDPEGLFALAERFGEVLSRKVDDLEAQQAQKQHRRQSPNVGILTDTACDLPEELLEILDIHRVPTEVIVDGKTYRDRTDITPSEVYELIRRGEKRLSTSQPPPAAFQEVMEGALSAHPSLVAIHLASSLSGTFHAAKLAASRFPDSRIAVVDSGAASIALGLVVVAAARAARAGRSFEEVLETARRAAASARLYVGVSSIEYLLKSGRVDRLRGSIARWTGLRPVFSLDARGRVVTRGTARGEEGLRKRILRLATDPLSDPSKAHFLVGHADDLDAARWYLRRLRDQARTAPISVVEISPALAVHTGPGVSGVAVLPAIGEV